MFSNPQKFFLQGKRYYDMTCISNTYERCAEVGVLAASVHIPVQHPAWAFPPVTHRTGALDLGVTN